MLNVKLCEVAVTQLQREGRHACGSPSPGRAPHPTWMKTATMPSLERLFGIRIDLTKFYRLAARDANLSPIAERFPRT
jgi:hypothetical protein